MEAPKCHSPASIFPAAENWSFGNGEAQYAP